MTASSTHSLQSSALRYGDTQNDRVRFSTGLVVTILLHGFVLWMLLRPHPLIPKTTSRGAEAGQMVFVAPLASNMPKPQKKPTPKPHPKEVHKPKPQHQQPMIAKQPQVEPPVTVAQIPPPDIPQTQGAPAEDMMARIEANRKRRAEARSQDANDSPPEEDENTRKTRIALANIAASQGKSGRDKDDSGGVFQIRNVSYHKAEFTFRGWNSNFRRNWSQQVLVEQGSDDDIETAIIKRMIELIRKYKEDDFVWDSHRLGKHVTLSARLEYTRELHQFLLKEFFPDYRPTARH